MIPFVDDRLAAAGTVVSVGVAFVSLHVSHAARMDAIVSVLAVDAIPNAVSMAIGAVGVRLYRSDRDAAELRRIAA